MKSSSVPAALLLTAGVSAAVFIHEPTALAQTVERAMFGNTFARNMISAETGLPADWDVKTGKNVKWWADVGSQAYAGPVVLGGRVFVGTNNDGLKNPKLTKDRGVIMAFAAPDGKFLWQMTHEKLPAGRVNDWPQQGICSTPYAEGNRIFYTSNRATIACLDTEGFGDGENDGAQDEKEKAEADGDIVWEFDMMKDLDVFPHNLAVSSPLVVDGILFATTGNGVDEGHINIPSPKAPSFIALDAKTGELLWENSMPADKIFHGTWSNPTYGVVKGRAQIIFPGGDGWIYSFEPRKGALLWKFNANPPGAKYILGGRGTANEVIGTPVLHEDRLYFGVGQDPEHGEGLGNFWCIDASLEGDITEKGKIWHRGGNDFRRTISTVAIQEGIVYGSDLSGFLYALDAKTGQHYWTHDMLAAVWGSPFVADGRVYLGDEDGDVEVLKAGKTLQVLGTLNMGVSVYSTPVAKDGVMYVLARNRLFALQQGVTGKPATPRQIEHPQ